MTPTLKGTPPVIPPAAEQDWGGQPGRQRRAALTGIYVLLAAITMLFAGFSSALVVRSGLGDDWSGIPIPPVLWMSTAAIALSSAVLEVAFRSLSAGNRLGFSRLWSAGTALGLVFLAGQWMAWQQLRAQGLYVSSSPGSSFFYLFTVAHALHVAGGIAALLYIEVQALRLTLGPTKRTAVEVTRLYWHFLAGLWLYLILLFQLWG
jgi:cytochrome c oxidase subunit 3